MSSTSTEHGSRTFGARPFGARRRAPLEPPEARIRGAGPVTLVRAVLEGARLTLRLMADSRVPAADRLAAAAGLGYLLWPLDLIPDFIPIVGQLDDLGIVVWSWRRLLQAAGDDVIRDRWRGDERALRLVLTVAGVPV